MITWWNRESWIVRESCVDRASWAWPHHHIESRQWNTETVKHARISQPSSPSAELRPQSRASSLLGVKALTWLIPPLICPVLGPPALTPTRPHAPPFLTHNKSRRHAHSFAQIRPQPFFYYSSYPLSHWPPNPRPPPVPYMQKKKNDTS